MIRATLLACALLAAAPSTAATQWISDVLTVPLRSGPSNAHRILHRGLPSGTPLEVLAVDDASGFAQVRTESGTEGWVNAQYLVAQPIARDQLATAQRRIQSLERQLAERGKQVSELTSSGSAANASNEELTSEVNRLTAELADLKRVSADALAIDARNDELNQLNGRLRSEIDELIEENHALGSSVEQRGMWIGAGLVLIGLIGGALLKSRPRRSGWS